MRNFTWYVDYLMNDKGHKSFFVGVCTPLTMENTLTIIHLEARRFEYRYDARQAAISAGLDSKMEV